MPVNELPFDGVEPVPGFPRIFKVKEENGKQSLVSLSKEVLTPPDIQKKFDTISQVAVDDRAAIPRPISWGQLLSGHAYLQYEWIEGADLVQLARVEGSTVLPLQTIINVGEGITRILTLAHQRGLYHGQINEKSIIREESTGRFYLSYFSIDELGTAGGDTGDLSRLIARMVSGSDPSDGDQWYQKRAALVPPHWSESEKNVPAWIPQGINAVLHGNSHGTAWGAGDLYIHFLKHQKLAPVPFERKIHRSEPQQGAGWASTPLRKKRSRPSIIRQSIGIALLVVGLVTGYVLYTQRAEGREKYASAGTKTVVPEPVTIPTPPPVVAEKKAEPVKKKKPKAVMKPIIDSTVVKDSVPTERVVIEDVTSNTASAPVGAYKVRSKAYFHNSPDPSTKRKAFIVHWNNAILHPVKEENDFVYIVFTNVEGQTSRGWIRKADLEPVE